MTDSADYQKKCEMNINVTHVTEFVLKKNEYSDKEDWVFR